MSPTLNGIVVDSVPLINITPFTLIKAFDSLAVGVILIVLMELSNDVVYDSVVALKIGFKVPLLKLIEDKVASDDKCIYPAKVAVPYGLVTLKSPELPVPVVAVICVDEFTVNAVASTPPKLTSVTPIKFSPVIVIEVPVTLVVGVKELITGAGIFIIFLNTETGFTFKTEKVKLLLKLPLNSKTHGIL